MTPRYQLFEFGDPTFTDRLKKISGPIVLEKRHVLNRVIDYAGSALKSKRIVLEEDYVGADYTSQLSILYSKCFKKFDNVCQRVHFFDSEISLENLRQADPGKREHGYLGYSVLTPLVWGKVGRTVLSPWLPSKQMLADDQQPKFCTGNFRTHIHGRQLVVPGAPFIEQDSMVMACAQASVWMAAFLMHGRYGQYGISRHHPGDITEAAAQYLPWGGRTLPSEGLLVTHMVNAFANMGYSPILLLKEAEDWTTDPLDLIQKYVDSNIPVVATLSEPAHAVVVVGGITSNRRRDGFNPDTQILSSDGWTSGLVVNDDQCGPYRIMPTSDAALEAFRHMPENTLLPPDDWWANSDCIDGLIVPLPKEVCIEASHIGPILELLFSLGPENDLLHSLVDFQRDNPNPFITAFLNSLLPHTPEQIVTRSYLIRAVEYLDVIRGKMGRGVVRLYEDIDWPLHIWVVEMSKGSEFDTKVPANREVIGEVIIDSTANRYAPSHLCVHFPGLVIRRDPDTEKSAPIPIEDDKPYASLI